jgi:hypothetical protein
MNKNIARFAAGAAMALMLSVPALAAHSDYLLEIKDIKGEAATSGEVLSWSWGTSNPGVAAPRDAASGQATGKVQSPRDPASGMSTGKRMHKPWPIAGTSAECGTSCAVGGVHVATGDVDGDGRAEVVPIETVDELNGFSMSFDKASPVLAKLCASGKHFPKATLTARGTEYSIEAMSVSGCPAPASAPAAKLNAGDGSMPNRISMNVTVPKQTQGATFGEKCTAGLCPAGMVTLTFTGQLKHAKTGHVTVLK